MSSCLPAGLRRWLAAASVLGISLAGCASAPPVLEGRWTAVPPALDGSGAGWRAARPAKTDHVEARLVNDGATLYLEFRARDAGATRWMLGGDDRSVIVWLDRGGGHSKELGIQFVPEVVPPAGWGGSGAPPDTVTRPATQILTSTAGVFAILPAGEQGIEAVRGTSAGRAVIELSIPLSVLHFTRPEPLAIGLEAAGERPRGPARPIDGVPGSFGPRSPGDKEGGMVWGLGVPLREGSGGRRLRPRGETGDKTEIDVWLATTPATGPEDAGSR